MSRFRGSIRVSEKHGVNPSVMLCFFCNESKGLALCGRLPDDKEAPREGVYDMEPCDNCKLLMQDGIILISVRDGESGKNPYRTGGWVVIKEEAIRRMIDPAMAETICKVRMSFVPDEAWKALGLPARGEHPEGACGSVREYREIKEQQEEEARGTNSPTDGSGA